MQDDRQPMKRWRRPSNATLSALAMLITAVASLVGALNGCSPT
jgi:hypothetical protein